jgi:hypothetical protein
MMSVPAAAHADESAPAPQITPVLDLSQSSLDEARAIIDVMMPPAKRPEIFAALTSTIMTQMRANATRQMLDPGLRQIIGDFLDTVPARMAPVTEKHIPALVDAMVQAYAREFTLDELRQIRAFADSPAGGHYLSRSTALVADPFVVAANQNYLKEATDLATSLRPELLAKVNAYLAEHPEALTAPKPSTSTPPGR